MSEYTYDTLDRSSNNIRLASIWVDYDDGRIRCSLKQYPLASAPPYIALSYAWGSPDDLMDIFLDTRPLCIRQNLAQGLRALCNFESHMINQNPPTIQGGANSPIWADALCIDQNNVMERGHQVNLMRDIYTSAKSVVVWLGPETNDSNTALNYICETFDRKKRASTILRRKRPAPLWDSTVETSVIDILDRPYWRRLWVVQEILLARKIHILCGSRDIEWDTLGSFVDWALEVNLSQGSGDPKRRLDQTPGLRMVANKTRQLGHPQEKYYSKDGSSLHLSRMIARYGDQECTDARDRIFGLLGLVDFGENPPVTADYSLSPEQLYNQISPHIRASLIPGGMPGLRKLLGLDKTAERLQICN